jgi:hypothetical protein
MRTGDIIVHRKYGKAKILKVYRKEDRKVAVLLDLLTEAGRGKFYYDRRGTLLRCYEDNLGLIITSS